MATEVVTPNISSAIQSLLEFPYLGNYLRLSMIEYDLLKLQGNEQILFVGSGPLPLTAIFLHFIQTAFKNGDEKLVRDLCQTESPNKLKFAELYLELIKVGPPSSLRPYLCLLDKSKEANEFAHYLIQTLGLSPWFSFTTGNAEEIIPEATTDIVYIASMAQPKVKIILNLIPKIKNDARFLIRGVEPNSLKELLYEPLDRIEMESITKVYPGFEEKTTFWPTPESGVINSVHIYQQVTI